jgi:hypothetical protein
MIVELVLMVLLAGYGYTLSGETLRDERREAAQVEANMRLGIGRYTGFDISGRRVEPAATEGVDRVVTFLLQADGLKSDLAIWQEVAQDLNAPHHGSVRLVAFCDGSRCAKDLGALAHSLAFQVMMYGEVVDAQAVFNADLLGECLVQKGGAQAFGVRWRDVERTPEGIRQVSKRILE